MVGNCEVLRVESVALLSTRKVVWCPLARIIISSSMFKGIWGQTEADLFGESLNLGFFFFLVNILFFSYVIYRCSDLWEIGGKLRMAQSPSYAYPQVVSVEEL